MSPLGGALHCVNAHGGPKRRDGQLEVGERRAMGVAQVGHFPWCDCVPWPDRQVGVPADRPELAHGATPASDEVAVFLERRRTGERKDELSLASPERLDLL